MSQLHSFNNKSAMAECPICFRNYTEVNPTTLPCGHSCCIEDAKKLQRCHLCKERILCHDKLKISYTIRELAQALHGECVPGVEQGGSDSVECSVLPTFETTVEPIVEPFVVRSDDSIVRDYVLWYMKFDQAALERLHRDATTNELALGFVHCDNLCSGVTCTVDALYEAYYFVSSPDRSRNKHFMYLHAILLQILIDTVETIGPKEVHSAKVLELMKQSADLGFVLAQLHVARSLNSLHYYKLAADQNDFHALNYLSDHYRLIGSNLATEYLYKALDVYCS